MFHLRTCAAKLRPLTASQTVKTFSQNRPAAARTFGQIRCYTAPVAAEPFLSGTSSNYVEEMYYAWLENPKSVHKVRLKGAGVRVWSLGRWWLAVQVSACVLRTLKKEVRQAARSPTSSSSLHQPNSTVSPGPTGTTFSGGAFPSLHVRRAQALHVLASWDSQHVKPPRR